MYISKTKKDENDSQKDIENPNLDKLYIREGNILLKKYKNTMIKSYIIIIKKIYIGR